MRKARILAVLLALITAVSFCVPAVYAKNAKFKDGTYKISVKLWDWQKDSRPIPQTVSRAPVLSE